MSESGFADAIQNLPELADLVDPAAERKEEDGPSCPAFITMFSGVEAFDLMCWLALDHEGPHMDVRGSDDQQVYWITGDQANNALEGWL